MDPEGGYDDPDEVSISLTPLARDIKKISSNLAKSIRFETIDSLEFKCDHKLG